jgi:hypothetical protein
MKYQLVLQFDASAIEDFDELLKLELDLGIDLGLDLENKHAVEGHDLGSDEMSLFINTDQPEKAFSIAKKLLANTHITKIVAAYRALDSEEYTVLYPENYGKVFCLA